MTRKLAREVAERFKGRRSGVVVFIAPTGYGKTEAAPYAFKNSGMPRAVHVAPMRTLVDAVYEKWLKHAGNVGLPSEEVGWQHMSAYAYGKSPYFLRRAVATTFDSFIYNLFKMPVARFGEERSHYELPRSSIFSSFIIYDEVHLYGGDPGNSDEKMFSSFLAAYRTTLNNPLLIITATLPSCVLEKVKREAEEHGVEFEVVDYYENPDEEFEKELAGVRIETEVVDSLDDVRPEGKKVLYVFNTVEKAVNFYRGVGSGGAVLIHGRFTGIDREEKEKKIKCTKIVVSTQVIEVGVDIDADTLVTDAAPLTSLIQRAGRVCRRPKEGRRCKVYVLRGNGDGIYDAKVVEKSLRVLDRDFDWRHPKDALTKVYKSCEVKHMPHVATLLMSLDSVPFAGSSKSVEIFEKLCGAVRDNIMVPVYVNSAPPRDMRELGMYTVAVSEGMARKILNESRKAVVGGTKLETREVSIGNMCRDLFSGRFLALYYPQGYNREYGLVL